MFHLIKTTRNFIRHQVFTVLRTYTSLQPVKEVEYIPGVQGYAPGFGPPPLKPKSPRKQMRKMCLIKAKERKEKRRAKASTKTEERSIENHVAQSQKPLKIPQTPSESILTIKQNIDVEGLSYTDKLNLIRKQYALELDELQKKREQKAAADALREKKKLEEEIAEKEAREKALYEARLKDHLSSFNLPKSDHEEPVEKIVNPFSDPELKAAREATSLKNYAKKLTKRKRCIKESLLQLFYASAEFVTPENIDAKLDLFIDNGSTISNAHSAVKLNISDHRDESISTRDRQLYDILEGNLNGKPGVEKIEKSCSSEELISDLNSVMMDSGSN